jgi:hypothetical protein
MVRRLVGWELADLSFRLMTAAAAPGAEVETKEVSPERRGMTGERDQGG